MNVLQKPQSYTRRKLCSFIQVSPFECCLPKKPYMVAEAREEPVGSSFKKGFFLLPFKYFLLHFCILTWYPFIQMGSFFS